MRHCRYAFVSSRQPACFLRYISGSPVNQFFDTCLNVRVHTGVRLSCAFVQRGSAYCACILRMGG